MDPERWRRVQELFDGCLVLEPEQRESWLQEKCAGDPALKADVLSLLESADEDHLGAILSEAADAALSGRDSVDGDSMIGRRIGAYRIVEEIGRGGMGVVYLAERADGVFEKHVAIKRIRTGLDSHDLKERFHRERRVLASLDHPHIARVLDGGTDDTGQPYVVMEAVDGHSLLQYCDKNQLTVDQRLELFVMVCEAVQYAHSRLIVHRDLKPANILVTDDGMPKLLDFGIAKLLDDDGGTEEITRVTDRLLTPEYASPEQTRGEAVTTASDIYTLGVVLYELLSGNRPYEVSSSSPAEIERIVCTFVPAPPSRNLATTSRRRAKVAADSGRDPAAIARARGTAADRLHQRLRGDLDTIVLKALHKEPEGRYATAQRLADDIRQHLAGQPVSARPATFRYRATKFVRRHRAAVAAAALIAATLLAATAATTAGLLRARRAEKLAGEEAERASRVTDFLVEMFEVSSPEEARGDRITAREMLDRGAQRIDEELADQPRTRARLLSTMGDVYRRLGLYPEAEPLLIKSLELARAQLGEAHLETQRAMQVLATYYWYASEHEEAESLLTELIPLRRQTLGDGHPDTVSALKDLADVYWAQGRYEEAEPLQLEALAARRRAFGDADVRIVDSLMGLGVLYGTQGRYDDAQPLFEEALAIYAAALGTDHPQTVNAMVNLANLHYFRGQFDEAIAQYAEALQTRKRV